MKDPAIRTKVGFLWIRSGQTIVLSIRYMIIAGGQKKCRTLNGSEEKKISFWRSRNPRNVNGLRDGNIQRCILLGKVHEEEVL